MITATQAEGGLAIYLNSRHCVLLAINLMMNAIQRYIYIANMKYAFSQHQPSCVKNLPKLVANYPSKAVRPRSMENSPNRTADT